MHCSTSNSQLVCIQKPHAVHSTQVCSNALNHVEGQSDLSLTVNCCGQFTTYSSLGCSLSKILFPWLSWSSSSSVFTMPTDSHSSVSSFHFKLPEKWTRICITNQLFIFQNDRKEGMTAFVEKRKANFTDSQSGCD